VVGSNETLINNAFVNNSSGNVETLHSCSSPVVLAARFYETFISRLSFLAGCELLRERYFTVGSDEPYSDARSFGHDSTASTPVVPDVQLHNDSGFLRVETSFFRCLILLRNSWHSS
jgi:hypothetical protein